MNWAKRILIALMMMGLVMSLPAAARKHGSGQRGSSGESLDSAVSRTRERTGGRVLSAETRQVDGRPTHFVRILTEDGKVRRLRVDAATGRFVAPRR